MLYYFQLTCLCHKIMELETMATDIHQCIDYNVNVYLFSRLLLAFEKYVFSLKCGGNSSTPGSTAAEKDSGSRSTSGSTSGNTSTSSSTGASGSVKTEKRLRIKEEPHIRRRSTTATERRQRSEDEKGSASEVSFLSLYSPLVGLHACLCAHLLTAEHRCLQPFGYFSLKQINKNNFSQSKFIWTKQKEVI